MPGDRRRIIGRGNAAYCAALLFVAVNGLADDVMDTVELDPANWARVEFLSVPDVFDSGPWQLVRFRYAAGNDPIAGRTAELFTELSTLSNGTVVTDINGIGWFLIRSESAGTDTVRVEISGVANEHIVTFRVPEPDGGQSRETFPMRFNGQTARLALEQDRIGILTAHGVRREDVQRWSEGFGIGILEYSGTNLYTLGSGIEFSQLSRWELARRLRLSHPSRILAAGLVTRPGPTRNPIVIDERMYVRFRPSVNDGRTRLCNLGLEVLNESSLVPNEFTVSCRMGERPLRREFVTRPVAGPGLFCAPCPSSNPLEMALDLAGRPEVSYAHPEVVQRFYQRGAGDPDPSLMPLFYRQWHLENTGAEGALPDADIDVQGAWGYSNGSDRTTIAVIDRSIFIEHSEFKDNLAPPEAIADLADDDNTSLLWDEKKEWAAYGHGTKAAGVAVARGDNGQLAGVCPYCRFLPIRVPDAQATSKLIEALDHAVNGHKADVVSMSLGWVLSSENLEAATANLTMKDPMQAASDASAVLVFAMPNERYNICRDRYGETELPDSSALHHVIAVAGVNDRDRRIKRPQGFGNCMDLMAFTGDRMRQNIWTASVLYDTQDQRPEEEIQFHDFDGTSAATPQVAGIAALVFDASRDPVTGENRYSPEQVRHILQDTADKIEGKKAKYDPETGFALSGNGISKHGYGRVNAFEAVRLAASSGKNGMDLFLRDHPLDWGNTEQPSNVLFESRKIEDGVWARKTLKRFQSPDIRVDSGGLQYAGLPGSFTSVEPERPKRGVQNRVFVRVRNRGPETVESAELSLFWTIHPKAGQLPDTMCDQNEPPDAPCWHLVTSKPIEDLAYSGASIAGCPNRPRPPDWPAPDPQTPQNPDSWPEDFETENNCPVDAAGKPRDDEARFTYFDLPPGLSWKKRRQRLALLATVESAADPITMHLGTGARSPSGDLVSIVTRDNNVTLWMDR